MSGAVLEPPVSPENPPSPPRDPEVDQRLVERAVREATRSPFYEENPTNPIYQRVGNEVLQYARAQIHKGRRPDDIRKEIREKFNQPLTLGEFRLLLATRRD